jgi:flagellar biogenesis protein FliO
MMLAATAGDAPAEGMAPRFPARFAPNESRVDAGEPSSSWPAAPYPPTAPHANVPLDRRVDPPPATSGTYSPREYSGVVPAVFEQAEPTQRSPLANTPATTGATDSPTPKSGTASQPITAGSTPAQPAAKAADPSAKREPSLPLKFGSRSGHSPHDKSSGSLTAMISVGSSLAVVLGLFFLLAWAMRKTSPRGSIVLPGEVFEVLGRAPLSGRQQVHLLRCGSKLLLVSVTPGGAETLTEVTDATEVDRLAGLCRQAHPQSATTAFRQIFQQFAPRSGKPQLTKSEIADLKEDSPKKDSRRWEKDHV